MIQLRMFPTLLRGAALALATATMWAVLAQGALAARIERVVSPAGIEAWLVSDNTLPLIAVNFAFTGGAGQDPDGKPGVAYLAASMLDEGAGDLDSKAYRDALDRKAIEIEFQAGRDDTRGSLRTLSANRDEAARLLKLALTAPRFDAEALERVRNQVLSNLRRQTTNPSSLASRAFWRAAYDEHPYARPTDGTLDSVPSLTAKDLKAFVTTTFGRDNLKIAIVGDIDAKAAGELIDQVFAGLPAKASLRPIAPAKPKLGKQVDVTLDVPQAVIMFGGEGLARNDPDFMAGYIVNHIIGGGTFSSRLYSEVREKRGLAYSVYTSLMWMDGSALFFGTTATRADRIKETLNVIEGEVRRMASDGPTQQELNEAKSYLKGSQMLSLDTSTKFAAQLVQYQLDNLGIDYIERRNGIIDAVSLEDTKRVSKRLFGNGLLVTQVGPAATRASQAAPTHGTP